MKDVDNFFEDDSRSDCYRVEFSYIDEDDNGQFSHIWPFDRCVL